MSKYICLVYSIKSLIAGSHHVGVEIVKRAHERKTVRSATSARFNAQQAFI